MDKIDFTLKKLLKKHETNDVEKLIKYSGILLLRTELDRDTWGFTCRHKRITSIVINEKISYETSVFVMAHELGHALLHKGVNTPFLRNVTTGTFIPRIEKEANQFAFKLLLNNFENYETLTKYQILEALSLPDEMERFIKK